MKLNRPADPSCTVTTSIFSSRLMMDDEDGDGDVLDNFLGKPTPDWAGAFGANFTIRQNLQINTLFEYKPVSSG